jgi:flagellar capping protein FliD
VVLSSFSNSGEFTNLIEIGISLDDDTEDGSLKLAIVDSSDLEDAIDSNYEDLTAFLDEIMDEMDTILDNYTGASGYIYTSSASMTTEWFELSDDIQEEQLRLIARREELETQYAEMQAQLLEMQYTFQSWQGIYSNTISFLS